MFRSSSSLNIKIIINFLCICLQISY
ncbi:hypothetical protein CY0110_17392 [Crocosphaera chwakensis CCY0110]|uniref:Uncharacterized protein n=1 Tax=Crocosphaera chwakensis CCY0110 TaxID=391612 RepID=A3IIG0_9CHRO|nr:hypothetical protein CY0110_17392 [Crocosphaera chwakensis CCY0110]